MKRSLNSLVLTKTLVDLGFLVELLEGCGGCRVREMWFIFPSDTDLLSPGDLELAVGHLYRLSFLEEDSQSW